MKTTLDITDSLFEDAKRVAARDGETLRSLVEQGLRKVLAERQAAAKPFKLKQVSFGRGGLRPEVAHLSPHELIHFSYEKWGEQRDLAVKDAEKVKGSAGDRG